ncbi:hypothetical protein KJ953_03020 [Patescibacteria group bacterium]|nr:hypothetical protein [Patescibacteria group bacterium]
MNKGDVQEAIAKKANKLTSYGIKKLNIHAIGRRNINKILNAVDKLSLTLKFDKYIESEGEVMVIKLTIFDTS